MKDIRIVLISFSLLVAACGDKSPQVQQNSAAARTGQNESPANKPASDTLMTAHPSAGTPDKPRAGVDLKVMGIGLGPVPARSPCKPREVVHRDDTSATIQLECSIGKPTDTTNITFSADGKRVVRVLRSEYLKRADVDPLSILRKAMEFYGKPDQFEEKYLFANYGDAYRVTHLTGATQVAQGESGTGMLITRALCGDGTFLTENCFGKGDYVIRFDLVDVAAFKESQRAGIERLSKLDAKKLAGQKF